MGRTEGSICELSLIPLPAIVSLLDMASPPTCLFTEMSIKEMQSYQNASVQDLSCCVSALFGI